MMFAIDLLKGQGRPKLKTKGTPILIAGALIVPVLIFLIMLGIYVSAGVDIPILQQRLDRAKNVGDSQLSRYDDQLEICKNYLADISLALESQQQWSNKLIEIVENMPDAVILDKLNCKTVNYSDRVPSKEDPSKMITVSKTRKLLSMVFITDGDRSVDSDMQDYVKNLSKLGYNAIIKNQENVYVNDKKVKKYQVECVLERT